MGATGIPPFSLNYSKKLKGPGARHIFFLTKRERERVKKERNRKYQYIHNKLLLAIDLISQARNHLVYKYS